MKTLALLVVALAGLAGVLFVRDASSQSFPFAIQQQGCTDCSDTTLDSIDNEYWYAEGTLSRVPFIWISKYPADIGVRRMRLTVTADVAVVYLISQPSSQSALIMLGATKTFCLANYGGAKAAVMIRGAGHVTAEFMNGDGGCSPGVDW